MNPVRALILTSIAALTFASLPSHAATESYVAGALGDLTPLCKHETPAGQNVGGVCFSISGATRVTLSVKDDVSANPGFWVEWQDAAGNTIGDLTGSYCKTKAFTIPAGAKRVKLWLDGVIGILNCDEGLTTTGTVTATFS